MKKALLFGASGFIGSHLIQELLHDDAYEQVTIVVRKNLGLQHPKLRTIIGDFHSLPQLKEQLTGDEVFLTLGTTKKHTPNQEEYYQIDHDYPILAAQIAKENGAQSVFIVTAIGANPNAKLFYTRLKGKVEQDIIALNFDHTHIFEPSMITGNRAEKRVGEKFFIALFKLFSPLLIGKLNKYKGIDGKNIAKAMHRSAENQTHKVTIYQWKEMHELIRN